MGLFEDIKAASAIESRELKAIKGRMIFMKKEYESALSTIEELKAQLLAAEDCHRDEMNALRKENATLKHAFSVAMEELSRVQHAKAAVVKNRNFYKNEFEAVGMLYKLTSEELEELKNKKALLRRVTPIVESPKGEQLEFFPAEEVKIAAAIGK